MLLPLLQGLGNQGDVSSLYLDLPQTQALGPDGQTASVGCPRCASVDGELQQDAVCMLQEQVSTPRSAPELRPHIPVCSFATRTTTPG